MEVHDLHLKSQVKEKGRYIEYSLKLTCLFAKRTDLRSGDYEIFLDALWISRCSLFLYSFNRPVMHSVGEGHCLQGIRAERMILWSYSVEFMATPTLMCFQN